MPPATGAVLKNPSPQRSSTNDELRARASLLDSEIAAFSALPAELDGLLTERAVVQDALDSILYPVLTLPSEITSQIFCWTLLPRAAPFWAALRGASLRLGQICRVWRQIALSTRGLWNTLDISVMYPSPRTLEAEQALVRMFLSRAGSSPLNISLYHGDTDSFRTMLDILIPYSRT
ncbi:hypothetical protein C8R46DRAFT_926914 [Mycena filopes]|nr:hypothetical protein C8R46DRAFT_926914 [Mycena filopes]